MTAPAQQHFQIALQHHQSGRLAEAERGYRQALALDANHADSLHMLGILAHQVGQNAVAADLIRKAIAIQPGVAHYHSNLGLVLNAGAKHAEAAAALEAAVRIDPSLAEAHNNLGIALWQCDQKDRAIAAWKEAIRLRPQFAEAHNSLGTAFQQMGQLEQAINEFRTALKIHPGLFETHNNLGIALKQQGHLEEAVNAFRLAIQLKPDRADFHDNLGSTLWALGRVTQAADEYRTAIRLQPDHAEFHSHLGIALWASGRLDEASDAIQTALRLDPNSADAHANLGNLLKDQGQLDQAIESYRRAVVLKPNDPAVHSSLIYLLHFQPKYDPESIRQELETWNSLHAEPLKSQIKTHLNARDPDRRLRIGYISPDFREHAVGRFMLPLMRNHDHQQYEIICYSDVAVQDSLTGQLRETADRWVRITGMNDADVAETIRQDQIDILVDLTAHTPGNRLLVFARKPAPVQVTYLSYPSTTGLETIDYRITDPHLDPPDESNPIYSEQSTRLPETYWCYEPGLATTDLSPLPALLNGHVTFGCLNTFRKVTTESLLVWSRILREVDHSRLLLYVNEGSHRQRVLNLFATEGIDSNRIEFIGHSPISQYMGTYQRIDIGLDPFPYTGGTTTCDALWMGVPVVTLAGHAAVHRGGVSILSNLGMPELIANSIDQYASIATALAANLDQLSQTRQNLRPRMQSSPLMNAPRFVRNVENAYRNMWQKWCSTGD